MIVIGIPMILVENVIGRRLRVNSIDAFGDKIKIKVKHIQILEDSWLHGASWRIWYHGLLHGNRWLGDVLYHQPDEYCYP